MHVVPKYLLNAQWQADTQAGHNEVLTFLPMLQQSACSSATGSNTAGKRTVAYQ